LPTGFLAYPSNPPEVGRTIKEGLRKLTEVLKKPGFSTWEENDIAGRFIVEPILDRIESSDLVAADITKLNFNVAYEVGYAIGRRKRLLLLRNSTLEIGDRAAFEEIGIFDTLGYQSYSDSRSLAEYLGSVEDTAAIAIDLGQQSHTSPVYLVLPKEKTDLEIRLLSRIKKARLQFRSYDPDEQGRLSAREAIDNIADSLGVVTVLVPKARTDSLVHNIRAAFVTGVARGLEKEMLLLQAGADPVPLDYRELVSPVGSLEDINNHVAAFAPEIMELLQRGTEPIVSERRSYLASLSLGASAAENELRDLDHYFLETDEYHRALRGEVQVIAGRKGSGKTALFFQLRSRLRQDKTRVVLDLKPEGFQLLKLKERLLDFLEEGTKEHTITAFWEYLLLLEACYKLLQRDKERHLRDHTLFDRYRALADAYAEDTYVSEGDFSERVLSLIQGVVGDFQLAIDRSKEGVRLSSEQITELLYKHDVARLRGEVEDYLADRGSLWIFFDNLDKGWPPRGLGPHDVMMLRCLLDALAKIERSLTRRDVECHGVVFLRNDVYELLVESTPDRGKTKRIAIDWTDPNLLRELLRKRFVYGGIDDRHSFEEIWLEVFASHVDGEESSQYLIDRCFMRPRALINLANMCRSHAVNLGHDRIEASDILQGETAYSTEMVTNIGLEIRDVFPEAGDLLYEFLESSTHLSMNELRGALTNAGLSEAHHEEVIDLLLWFGVLGFVRAAENVAYIHNVNYDMKRLKGLISRAAKGGDQPVLFINPALWAGLEIKA